jgi:hypothetical protein
VETATQIQPIIPALICETDGTVLAWSRDVEVDDEEEESKEEALS